MSHLTIPSCTRLLPTAQCYEWGKVGPSSLVAQLLGSGNYNVEKPYAELWMGIHPKSPSSILVKNTPTDLAKVIATDPIGTLGRVTHYTTLPFLFKILSVGAPLSIQAHPDLTLAKVLHAKDAKNYPDINHKPEIAIALTTLHLLNGFRTADDIAKKLTEYPELAALIGGTKVAAVKDIYTALLVSPASDHQRATTQLAARLRQKSTALLSNEDRWFLRAFDIYGPGDVGLFAFYLLQLQEVAPGYAVYTGPNVPHAYLDGDLVECMANSDNVVRAGLTQKFQDKETLLAMLDYRPVRTAPIKATPDLRIPHLLTYTTPASEFEVQRCISQGSKTTQTQLTITSATILICLSGTGEVSGKDGVSIPLAPGTTVFIRGDAGTVSVDLSKAELFIARIPYTA